jgi:hypothetical protein
MPCIDTYSNYAEAQRAFWRNTVLPLVARTTKALSAWLSPAYDANLLITPNLDEVDALAPEREALWSRLDKATFLTIDEKREAAGYGPTTSPLKSNPNHDDLGRFTFGDGEGDDDQGNDGELTLINDNPDERFPLPNSTSPPKKLEDILKPDGGYVGERGSGSRIRTVPPGQFEQLLGQLLNGTARADTPPAYLGKWFSRKDGTIFGVRNSLDYGPTIEVIKPGASGIKKDLRIHRR